MTGIEILTSAQVISETAFNWTAFWITFGIFFVIIEFVAIDSWLSGESDWTIIPSLTIVCILGVLLGNISGTAFGTPTAYETQYKVTISDEVSMNDFYERYEVIDQEGKIFTVRERVE